MKPRDHTRIRSLLLMLLVASLALGSGCGPKSISKETLNYFYGLVTQQYWQKMATGLTLEDEYGTEQAVIAPVGTSDKQQYILFGDVTVTASNTKVGPIDAVIKAKLFDGTTERDVRVRVDDANLATLQKTLPEAFESKSQRDQRLKEEQYTAKIKEADTLLSASKVADAIAALKAAQAIKDSDEVKIKLDAIYLKQGKYYYGQKKYDVALAQLRLITFDATSLAEAKDLILKVQADADKAAAAKAAADKAAAAKAAATKAAAARNKPKSWKNVFSVVGESPTEITRKFTIDSDRWLLMWTGDLDFTHSRINRMGANSVWVELYDSSGKRPTIDPDSIVWDNLGGAIAHLYGAGTYTVVFDVSTDLYLVAVSQWK